MKRTRKRLSLDLQTVRPLGAGELRAAQGGNDLMTVEGLDAMTKLDRACTPSWRPCCTGN